MSGQHIHVNVGSRRHRRGRAQQARQAALAALSQTKGQQPSVALTIRLTGDEELRALNKQFRGVGEPTDVLSFGGEDYLDGARIRERVARSDNDKDDNADSLEYLGDVVISMQRCEAQARQYGHDVDDELTLLIIHGVLHLLGYDHGTASRKQRMWQAQDRAFALLEQPNPLKPDQFHD